MVGSLFDVVSQPFVVSLLSFLPVPTVSPSRGWDVAVYVFDINQPSLSTPFNSVLVSVSVLMSSWVHGGDVAVYVFDIN